MTGEKQQRALKDIQESWPSWDPTKPHFALRAGGREEIPSTVALPLIYTIKVKVMSIIKLPLWDPVFSTLYTLSQLSLKSYKNCAHFTDEEIDSLWGWVKLGSDRARIWTSEFWLKNLQSSSLPRLWILGFPWLGSELHGPSHSWGVHHRIVCVRYSFKNL